jgi:hypothetical protein
LCSRCDGEKPYLVHQNFLTGEWIVNGPAPADHVVLLAILQQREARTIAEALNAAFALGRLSAGLAGAAEEFSLPARSSVLPVAITNTRGPVRTLKPSRRRKNPPKPQRRKG